MLTAFNHISRVCVFPHFNSIKIDLHHYFFNWMNNSLNIDLYRIRFGHCCRFFVFDFQYHIPFTIPKNNNNHFENNDVVIGYLFHCLLPMSRRVSKWCQIVISFCWVHCILLFHCCMLYLSTIVISYFFSKRKFSTATLNVSSVEFCLHLQIARR